jgi:DNA-binding transcriptional MerR regulator
MAKMTPLSTDDFPYTIGYVSELLALDEPQLMTLVSTLGLNPKKEDDTGRTLFTHQELDQLKKAAELQRHGDNLETIGRHLGPNSDALTATRSTIPGASLLTAPPSILGEGGQERSSAPSRYQPEPEKPRFTREESKFTPQPGVQAKSRPRVDLPGRKESPNGGMTSSPMSNSRAMTASSVSTSSAGGAADSITVMVEAVSQVKEGILKDLGRLLDDKLAGLDEVVVELIRCKSENDSLKKKLNEAVRARENLEQELGRFKPVQFGFYRKL